LKGAFINQSDPMSVIAITGASGYFGQRIIAKLENEPECEKIIGIARRNLIHSFKNLDYYQLDVRNPSITNLFKKNEVDTLIHLAFVVNPIHDTEEMHSIDVNGTKNVLKAAKISGIKRILLTSSTMVYGAWPDNPAWLTEESPLRGHPTYYYNQDKVEIERLCQSFRKENPNILLTIIRPCLVLGPNVNHFYSRIIGWPILPLIDGNNPPMQFVHEDDVARAYLTILKKEKEGIFNIVGKGTLKWKEVIKMGGKPALSIPSFIIYPVMNAGWKLRFPLIESPADILDFIKYPWVASGQKAKKELGFVPKYSTKEALEIFLENRKARVK
jgi:UDP-glucose 4-epimerase